MRLSAPTRARSSVFSSSVRATIVGKEQECCHRTRRRKPRIPFAVRGTDGVLPHPAPGPMEPSLLCDIALDGPRIASVARSAAPGAAPPVPGAPTANAVDLDGAMVFPGFVDAHVHLDKAH